MKHKSFADMNCSLAQALEVVGERWTLLILREAFQGVRRFDQIQRDLGIARNILAARLEHLVEEGILERRLGDHGRDEYVLTPVGLDLQPAMIALTQWGDRHRPHPAGDRLVFVERETQEPIAPVRVQNGEGRALTPRDVRAVAGPGMRAARDAAEGQPTEG